MSRYILGRLLLMIPLLVGISLVTFAIVRFAPGDPARLLADPEQLTTTQLAAARQELGLDDPAPVQYAKMMRGLLTGQLLSFKTRRPTLALIAERLPTTATLSTLAFLFGITGGVALGVAQALRPYGRLDDLCTAVSLFGFAVPGFWLAQMLVLLFAVRLRWLPAGGIRPVGATGWNPLAMAPYLVLPTLVLGTGLLAGVARYTRSAMLDALGQDYVRTARAKGLAERVVVARHALRNSLLPVITLAGFYFPALVGGAVVVETIFALPGVGRLALDSVFARDYPMILTINLLGAAAVLVGNLFADIGYAVVDPRIRFK
ncbi:MAG TPA: ABC transporter permease [Thermomicrobiales bacterium]|nr:ABC transporter permease [Thermomicrobiales bacterium]